MDGASKFVRGDAMAGIMILIINIIGGFAVGVMQHDMTFADAGTNYVLLAIGDGLVAQVQRWSFQLQLVWWLPAWVKDKTSAPNWQASY